MNKRAEFPKVCKRHGITVTIFKQDRGGYSKYRVVYYEAGRRKELCRADYVAALAEAELTLDRLSTGAGGLLELKGTERLAWLRAHELLKPFGLPLDLAAAEYAAALKFLGNSGTLLEAAKFYREQKAKQMVSKEVDLVVTELLESHRRDGSSPRHVEDLESRLNRFKVAFKCDIASVTAGEIYSFLQNLGLSSRSQNNYRMAISNLFSFARLKAYVAADYDPVAKVPVAKEADKPIGIYTPSELRLLLKHAPKDFLPYLVIAAFAGLRQSEIERLRPEHVTERYIRVPTASYRVKSRRIVTVTANLAQWLKRLLPLEKVVPYANPTNVLLRLLGEAGVTSLHNGLRHSWASYSYALSGDAAKVSMEMGNSPQMVFRNYREVVTTDIANEWFGIFPDGFLEPVPVVPEVPNTVPSTALLCPAA